MTTGGARDNLSAVLKRAGEISMEQREIPKAGPNEVVIAIHSVGICGSDIHYWMHGAIGDFVLRAPMVLGHESAGTVVETGDGVVELKVGDRVAVEPGVPCRRCVQCKIGRYNICADMAFAATPPVHGTLTRFYKHDADFCYKLPDHVSCEEGALLEPLSVAVHACRRAQVSVGSTLLICGAGPIGLVNLLTAKAMGAAKVIVTDINGQRLKKAKELGADVTLLVEKGRGERELAEHVVQLMAGRVDTSIECSGSPSSLNTAIYATKSGGVLVVVGLGPATVNLPMVDAGVREVDIRGIFRYANCYPTALNMVSSGQVDVKPLISHRFALEQSVKAFETARDGTGNAIKVVISCAQSLTKPAAKL